MLAIIALIVLPLFAFINIQMGLQSSSKDKYAKLEAQSKAEYLKKESLRHPPLANATPAPLLLPRTPPPLFVPTNQTKLQTFGNPEVVSKLNQTQGSFSTTTKAMLAVRKPNMKTKTNRVGSKGEAVKADANEIRIEPPPPPAAAQYMRHRLRDCLEFWKTFATSTMVLNWIEHGFDLRWRNGPPSPNFSRNHKSAYDHSAFVTLNITELLAAGSIEQVSKQPYNVSALGVCVQKEKCRLIFDGRYINEHLIIPSFKYEDLSFCEQYIQPNDFMISYDYSKGYHHLDIHPDFWQFLGFEWKGSFYVYTCLPFGLASGPWAFTKLTKELVNRWRRMGHRCSPYIDDSIHCHQNETKLYQFGKNILIPDMLKCGFVVNLSKSQQIPSQRREYIGAIIDTVNGNFEIPQKRRDAVLHLIRECLNHYRKCSVHNLEILAGNIASMHWAFGKLSRLMSLSIYADISNAKSRSSYVPLSDTTIQDLKFWLTGFDIYNGFKSIWQPTGFDCQFNTDAAGASLKNFGGWAGWTEDCQGEIHVAKGLWTAEIGTDDHSTFLELLAVFYTVKSFNSNGALQGKRILTTTDNQGVFFIINKAGSRDSKVHALCKELLWYCIHHNISVVAAWVPRELNQLADFYSKLIETSDWKLNPDVFRFLQEKYGPFDIDLFASYDNHQLPLYYSLYYTPDAAGIDAFLNVWGRKCWCNPPFQLMARVLSYAAKQSARMCLVCPFTPSAPWWPTLTEDGGTRFAPFVKSYVELGATPDLHLAGKHAYQRSQRRPRWLSLALIVDFAANTPHSALFVPRGIR
jgi:hypothetical protein